MINTRIRRCDKSYLLKIIIEEMNKDNYDEDNIQNIKQMIGAYDDKDSFIKEESRKKLAHALINS